MADTYAGPATMVVGDREWKLGTVHLRKRLLGGLESWTGEVPVIDAAAAQEANAAGSFTLRLPGGREGQADWGASSRSGGSTLGVFVGAGPPPF